MSTPRAPDTTQISTGRPVGAPRLTLLHYRYLFLETIRVPITVVSTTVFPALSLMFFVIPQDDLATDPVIASAALAWIAAGLPFLGLGLAIGYRRDEGQRFR